MTKKEKFEKPSMEVFELKQQQQLLAGSGPLNAEGAEFEDYQDGVFSW